MSGRIESGSLQQGDSLLVLPANEYATVRGESLFDAYTTCSSLLYRFNDK